MASATAPIRSTRAPRTGASSNSSTAPFDQTIASSPETLTALGIKTNYDKLNDYTDAQRQRQRDLAERQLAEMKAQFDYARLSPAGQLSYRMFENNVVRGREQFQWRWHSFPVRRTAARRAAFPSSSSISTGRKRRRRRSLYFKVAGGGAGHGEVSANVRHQAGLGILPPAFNFAPVRADARKVISGAPFGAGPTARSSPTSPRK
jgi:hypothetical protein